jgi:3-(3-hydroxy-phenyl)propionate hydroxylase
VRGAEGQFHLTQCFGRGFVGLVFGADGDEARIEQESGFTLVHLPAGQAAERYGVAPGAKALVVVRPDGYVFGRWDRIDLDAARAELKQRGVQP